LFDVEILMACLIPEFMYKKETLNTNGTAKSLPHLDFVREKDKGDDHVSRLVDLPQHPGRLGEEDGGVRTPVFGHRGAEVLFIAVNDKSIKNTSCLSSFSGVNL
jgi:hypothetical protein